VKIEAIRTVIPQFCVEQAFKQIACHILEHAGQDEGKDKNKKRMGGLVLEKQQDDQ
jgi:hypothetical protein